MRTHKKCYWCNQEIKQKDLYLIKKLGVPIHEECDQILTKLIKEASQ
jgi:hypothetical protein